VLEKHAPGSCKILIEAFQSQVKHRQELEREQQKEVAKDGAERRKSSSWNRLLAFTFVAGPFAVSAAIHSPAPLGVLVAIILFAATDHLVKKPKP
jgi:hypothetical protein